MAVLAVASLVAGCGGTEQNAGERPGNYPVSVSSSFPTSQTLAEQTSFTVRIKNIGKYAMPNVAVTVLNPRYGDAAQSFGELIKAPAAGQPLLASRSRPIWMVDQEPGPCGYSCHKRGPGAAATAYTDTWALGRLKPGHTAVFTWKLTAVKPGSYTVEYEVAAGLNGDAKAVLSDRSPARGRVSVQISSKPPSVTVGTNGAVTTSSA